MLATSIEPDRRRDPHYTEELCSLSSMIGCRLALYRDRPKSPSRGCQTAADFDVDLTTEFLEAGIRSCQATGYSVTTPDANHQLVCLRLPAIHEGGCYAVGVLAASDRALVERLVRAAHRIIEQQRQLDGHSDSMRSLVEQLSYGFEEQTWLRSLSQQMRVCSAGRKNQDVVAELLPSLQSIVCCEALAFLPCRKPPTDREISAGDMLWSGHEYATPSLWRDWIESAQAGFARGPVIHNASVVPPGLARAGVRSLCAAAIQQGSRRFGWLIAVNHLRRPGLMSPGTETETWEDEFTTVEAGLLQSAGDTLGVQGCNRELLEDREDLIIGIIRSMGAAIDARDPYTRGHSERVARYGRRLASTLGVEAQACQRLYLSGLLHDIGKIGVPDAVLRKPGALTPDEFALIQKHPEIGVQIIQGLPHLRDLEPGILHHHESIDGSGYPHGLRGSDIPEMARILAVADTFDALTSKRPYRDGMSYESACSILVERAGVQWDPRMVEAFLKIPQVDLIHDAALADQTGWQTNDVILQSSIECLSARYAVQSPAALV